MATQGYLSAGTIDQDFAFAIQDGQLRWAHAGPKWTADEGRWWAAAAVHPDGVAVAGTQAGEDTSGGDRKFAVALLDAADGHERWAYFDYGFDELGLAVAVAANGEVVMGGALPQFAALLSWSASGDFRWGNGPDDQGKWVENVAFDELGRAVAVLSDGINLIATTFDPLDGEMTYRHELVGTNISAVLPDGRVLAVADGSWAGIDQLFVYDLATNAIRTYPVAFDEIRSLSGAGQRVYLVGEEADRLFLRALDVER